MMKYTLMLSEDFGMLTTVHSCHSCLPKFFFTAFSIWLYFSTLCILPPQHSIQKLHFPELLADKVQICDFDFTQQIDEPLI